MDIKLNEGNHMNTLTITPEQQEKLHQALDLLEKVRAIAVEIGIGADPFVFVCENNVSVHGNDHICENGDRQSIRASRHFGESNAEYIYVQTIPAKYYEELF